MRLRRHIKDDLQKALIVPASLHKSSQYQLHQSKHIRCGNRKRAARSKRPKTLLGGSKNNDWCRIASQKPFISCPLANCYIHPAPAQTNARWFMVQVQKPPGRISLLNSSSLLLLLCSSTHAPSSLKHTCSCELDRSLPSALHPDP